MLYSVKEVAELSGATIKALHHYHKIGLLLPSKVSEAGYRLYGREELERLQQILLYRELDFTLEQIKQLLEEEPNRLSILTRQEELLHLRRRRLDTIIDTLRKSIMSRKKGEPMEEKALFTGLASSEEWKVALKEQQTHLQDSYNYELDTDSIDPQHMNETASEAAAFMTAMADALRAGVKSSDDAVADLIRSHLKFLNIQGHPITAEDFKLQNRFFLSDDFHLQMLEGQQTGLAYYLAAAADAYALSCEDQ